MDYLLKKGELISLSVKACYVVRVNKGNVWLTHGGECRDYILKHGDKREFTCKEMIVLEALTDSVVAIESLSSRGYPRVTVNCVEIGPTLEISGITSGKISFFG